MNWKDILHAEIEKGGNQPPCPLCHVPRVKRSDYIRCCRCGINWMTGEVLDKNPRHQRQRQFLESVQRTAKHKEEKE